MSARDSTRAEVRKTVTVLFSDGADSTPLGETLDLEQPVDRPRLWPSDLTLQDK